MKELLVFCTANRFTSSVEKLCDKLGLPWDRELPLDPFRQIHPEGQTNEMLMEEC